ncbi:hypothetical protein MLD38_034961 [Melastoma candidum]|uniref:Uncharacterized protein n=1 Tax=Melastoma candidum TaxID=119954 RepID=A0ACB9MBJ8_9MYRT|nr:hypothetical protein MLD38_034961 [Melastoma candidum]
MAPPKASLAILVSATLLFLLNLSEVGADGSASVPVSDNIARTFTATKDMAHDAVNSAAPKAGEVGQAVKDTAKSGAKAAAPMADKVGQAIKGAAKSAADNVSPAVEKAGDVAEETTHSLRSWFRDRLANLGIIHRGPAQPVKPPASGTAESPASNPAKFPRTP